MAETIEFQAKKLNADQLLQKQKEAVVFITEAVKKIEKPQLGRSAPFLKSLGEVSKSIKQVEATANAKDNKKFGQTLPILALSIAELNQTYTLSQLKDEKIKIGVDTLAKV